MLSIGIQDTKKENKLRVKQYLSLTGTFFLFFFFFSISLVVKLFLQLLLFWKTFFFPFCPMFVFTAKCSSYALILVLYKKKLRNKVPSLKNRCVSVHIYLTQDRNMKYDIAWDASKNAFHHVCFQCTPADCFIVLYQFQSLVWKRQQQGFCLSCVSLQIKHPLKRRQ